MPILAPWRAAAPGPLAGLNESSLLSRALAFAWKPHLNLDQISGARPVVTGGAPATLLGRRTQRFTGLAGSSENLNFGAVSQSADLAMGGMTAAFYFTINDPTSDGWSFLGSRTNGSATAGGWGIRGNSSSTYFDAYLSGGRVESGFHGLTLNNYPNTLVITYDGGTLQAGIKCYINGRPVTASSGNNGSGTQATDAASPLYIGAHRLVGFVDNALKGDLMVALLARRVWTDAEAALFASDPYGVFAKPSSKVFAFGFATTAAALGGVGGFSFDGTGALTIPIAMAGVGGFALDGSGTLHTVGSVGDFEDVPCDCPPGPPLSFPVIGGGSNVGDFEDVDCGCAVAVRRAIAISSNVVRVAFAEAPKFKSPSGVDDAQNPANYVFSIATGQATPPTALWIAPALIVGPTRGVGNGGNTAERGVDITVDRPLIVGVIYEITISNIVSADGSGASSTTALLFGGIVDVQTTMLPPKKTDLVDLFNSPFNGTFVVDDSGDIAPMSGIDGFKKRVIRRILTPKNAFAFLLGYGVGVKLKEVASLAQISAMKTDIIQQVMQEPETASVDASTTLDSTGVLTINLKIKTKVGAFVTVGVQASPNGGIVVL